MTDETLNSAPNLEPAATTTDQEATGTSTVTTAEPKLGFFDSLTDDLKSEASLANFKDKDISDLAKGYVSSQRELGSRIRIPGPDASKEAKDEFYGKLSSIDGVIRLPNSEDPKSIDAFYAKLGRPENPEGYEFNLGEDVTINPEENKLARELAYKAGLTKEQGKIMSQLEAHRIAQAAQKQEATKQATTAVLKEKWGNEFENRLHIGGSVMRHFATKYPNEVKDLVHSGAGNNPVFLLMLAELGNSYKEAGVIQGVRPSAFNMTPEEATNRIQEIQKNPELRAAYLDERNPKHQEVVNKMAELYRIKSPNQENI